MVVHDLVVENREVESEAKSNWVASIEALGCFLSILVVLEGTILDSFKSVSSGAFCNISIIVTNHLEKECLGLIGLSLSVALILDNSNDSHALVIKLILDPLFVCCECLTEFRVFWVLLNGADGSNGSSLRADLVLETDGKKVSLLSGEILGLALDNLLEECDHVVESLGLLSNSSHENILFQTHCDFFRLAYTINKIKKFELRRPLNSKNLNNIGKKIKIHREISLVKN